MSITNKKIDALRRLLLGELYQECKENPMGVSRKRLEEHIEKIKGEGCIGDCSIEEFVKTCQLKTHYPTCVSNEYRECMEGVGERSRGADKARFEMYKKAKEIEDEPDEEEEEEENVCNICWLDGDDEKGEPVREMSCGHYSHVNCLIKIAQQKGRDNAECPECRREFSLTEVPVPVRTLYQRQEDSMRRAQFNASQMGFNEEEEEEEEEEDLTEEERLHESILNNIRSHNIDEAVREIRELTSITPHVDEQQQEWLTSIINIIPDITKDDIISFMDSLEPSLTILHINIRKLNEFLQNDQRDKAEYIIDQIVVSHIEIDEEDTLIRLLRRVITSETEYLLKAILNAPTEEEHIEYLKTVLDGILSYVNIENQDIQRIINLWYVRNDFDEPEFSQEESDEEESGEEESDEEINPIRRLNFDDDEDDRPLQISRITPPDQKIYRWFNRVRR